jgi:signal transduction histidine kinase
MLRGVKDVQRAPTGDRSPLSVIEALIDSSSRSALLKILHRYVESLFPDPYSSLWIADEERKPTWLLLVDEFGGRTTSLPMAHQRIAIGEGVTGRAMLSQDILVLDMKDREDKSRLLYPHVIDEEGIRQLIAIPISSSAAARGVLLVGTRDAKGPDYSDINNLRSVAGQAVTLMSRLYEQELTRTITQSIWELFQDSDDQHYPQKFIQKLLKVVKADWGSIIVRENEASTVTVLASIPRTESNAGLPLNDFFRILTRRPIRLFDISADANDSELNLYGLNPQDLSDASCWLSRALAPGDHIIAAPFNVSDEERSHTGAVIFGRHRDNFGFLRQDEELLATSAAFLTVLINYRQKLLTQEDVLTVAQDVATAREIHSVAESALLGAVKVTGAKVGFVALRDDDNQRLQLADTFNLPTDIRSDLREMIDSTFVEDGSAERLIVLRPLSPTLLRHMSVSYPELVEIIVPIAREGQLVGMLALGVPETRWSNEEAKVQALRLFADQLGIAHSERLLADRAERFRLRIDQIASEATASLVAISLAHEVKNAVNVLGVGIARLGPISNSLRSQNLEIRERRRLADRLDDVHKTTAAEIVRVADLANIVRDLTTGGSLQDSLAQGEKEVYLNEVVTLWAKLLQDMAHEYGVKLSTRYDAALDHPKSGKGHPCVANPARLGQIIINLLTNAFQASHAGSRVDLSTSLLASGESTSKIAALRVQDYGRGMDDDVRRRSFDMFFSTKKKGYGLGLPVVKAIVDSFGGTIDVKSEIGKGTTFVIRIPCR